jgi:sugar/nucleoside kinase (ribokinase family)
MAAFTLTTIISRFGRPANVTLVHPRAAFRVMPYRLIVRFRVTIIQAMRATTSDFALLGSLDQEFGITPDGQVRPRALGGDAVYAATGARIWSDSVAVISRVGKDFPRAWLLDIATRNISTQGVRILSEPAHSRSFFAYPSESQRVESNPAAHYRRVGAPIPKELLDDALPPSSEPDLRESPGPLTLRPIDLNAAPMPTRGAHICPTHVLAQALLPTELRARGVPRITLDPTEWLMHLAPLADLQTVVRGLDAFLPSDQEALAFCRPEHPDLAEAAEAFGAMGCRIVVIKCGAQGSHVFEGELGRHWHVPAYPVHVRDPNGAGDAFCGGFLAGLGATGDGVQASLYGTVSASMVIEGSGAFFALDAMPGLAQARLEAARSTVRRV